MKTGLVSVIVPTFNRAPLLVEAIASAMVQSYDDIEIVVVDDGSDDDTESQVARLQGLDSRIRYLKQRERRGHALAMQIGLDASEGEFVQFLDSDDILHRDKMRVQVETLRESADAGMAVCHALHFISRPGELDFLYNTFHGEDPLIRFVSHDVVWVTICALWRREALDRIGGLDVELTSSVDYELHTRALILGERPILQPHVLAFYRQHAGPTIGKGPKPKRVRMLLRIFRKLTAMLRARGMFRERLAKEMRDNFLWSAARGAHLELADVCVEALSDAAAIGGSDDLREELLACHEGRFADLARLLEARGIDVLYRERWFMRHRALAEGLEPTPPARRYRRRGNAAGPVFKASS